MGGNKSKPKPPPVVEASPKVAVDSPSTINTSTGFHILELHGPTANTMLTLGVLLLLLAIIMWRTGAWRKMKAKKKRERISRGAIEEMELEMGLPPDRPRQWTRPVGRARLPMLQKGSQQCHSLPQEPSEAVKMVLPIISALARQTEEEDALRRGSTRLTEIPVGGRVHPGGPSRERQPRDMWQDAQDEVVVLEEPTSPRRGRY